MQLWRCLYHPCHASYSLLSCALSTAWYMLIVPQEAELCQSDGYSENFGNVFVTGQPIPLVTKIYIIIGPISTSLLLFIHFTFFCLCRIHFSFFCSNATDFQYTLTFFACIPLFVSSFGNPEWDERVHQLQWRGGDSTWSPLCFIEFNFDFPWSQFWLTIVTTLFILFKFYSIWLK